MASDCILGARLTKDGYARTSAGRNRDIYAHRMVWEKAHGPIPEGHHVHHACGNRACVNVEHLRLVTKYEHPTLHRKCDHEDRSVRTDGRSYCLVCKRKQDRDQKRERYRTDPEFRAKVIASSAAYYRRKRATILTAT